MTNLPLCRTWERDAARELAQILYLVTIGGYANVGDLCHMVRNLSDYLEQEYSSPGVEDEAKQLFDEILDSLTGERHDRNTGLEGNSREIAASPGDSIPPTRPGCVQPGFTAATGNETPRSE